MPTIALINKVNATCFSCLRKAGGYILSISLSLNLSDGLH